jgi:hypothetical protein
LLQTYVLKVMMNIHGQLSARLNEKCKREFITFTELEPARKALRAVGKRDGLAQFYQSFTSKVPATLIAMVAAKFGEEFARLNFPPASGKIASDGCRGADSTTGKLPLSKKSACAQRSGPTGAAAHESLRWDRPGGLASPAFHACGSTSYFSA